MTTVLRSSISPRPERLFTVEEYLRMTEVGILTEKDKVELLNGRIVEKMARSAPHDSGLQRITNALMRVLPDGYLIHSQSALRLPKSESVPKPDIGVVRGPVSRYDERHPSAEDAVLVIDVSDSTLADDQGEKLTVYAAAAVPLYWILNLVDRRIEVYSDPTGPDHFPDYRIRQDMPEGASVTFQLPQGAEMEFSVTDMLPVRQR